MSGLKTKDSRLIGFYIGLWMGDGTQYYSQGGYRIKICCNKIEKNLNHFIQTAITNLFNKKTVLIEEKDTNRAYIKFSSKYIYHFVNEYVYFEKNKTASICLKKIKFSRGFLDGCLLGLILSDGHLKYRFHFNVISRSLAEDMIRILEELGFSPSLYIHNRKKYGWHDLYMVSLPVKESAELHKILNKIIRDLGFDIDFKILKKMAPT
ncbi:LAGLIDADG family homing endonuclease [Candidatus Woesearchaeota archaeon]|nr:LAGLIDADG family homing endonuclease [Candidatus Woesearchaeota archaeon]